MLKQRIITAVALLAVLLPALFYPSPTPFCVVALVLIAAAGWEWGRLNGLQQTGSFGLAAVCLVICSACWAWGWLNKPLPLLWSVAGIMWVLGGGLLLARGPKSWARVPRGVRLVGGVIALCLAWLAIAQARVLGVEFLLSAMLLVWTADIGAYFAGRRFGGRFTRTKLAPSISPGKSWEGVWGGMVGVLLLAGLWLLLDSGGNTLFHRLLSQHGAVVMALALVFLAAMSVVGDLVESLIKRSAGAKDSSGLLPGHGGVLDRVDALLPTLPLAMMLISF